MTLYRVAIVLLAILSAGAVAAQNRPQCLPAPTGPGACFIDGSVFPSLTLTGVDADGDYISITVPISQDDAFVFLPSGGVRAHLSDQSGSFVVCPATAPASCAMDGTGSLTGSGRLQLNTFVGPGGVTTCPGTINAAATVSDGTTEFDLTYSVITVANGTTCRTIIDDIEITLSN